MDLNRSPRLPCVESPKVRACGGSALREQGRERGEEMTVKTAAWISKDRKLIVDGRTVLADVPAEVTASAAGGLTGGLFLGVGLPEPGESHVVPIGKLRNTRFIACFRFKLWWMTQRMGQHGQEVPTETQFLLLELPPSSSSSTTTTLYTALLPLLDGPYRASLRGSPDSSLLLSLDSGDPSTTSSTSTHSLLIGPALPDPFTAISSTVSTARHHLGTFRQLSEKPLPPIVDLFGWCTWDAFYQDVSQSGVETGLRSFSSGGIVPRFVIIDDGWQTVSPDPNPNPEKQGLMRLTKVEENNKFKTDTAGISYVVDVAKRDYGVKYVYTWHAIIGYWGGVGSTVEDSVVRYPEVCEGVIGNDPPMKVDQLVLEGVGVVNPRSIFGFYDELHGYLEREGVDGVKVDVQSVLETLGRGFGGRVQLAKVYHEALDRSVAKHFNGTGIIACMSHSSDAIYCSKQTAVVRASDDFYPRDPVSHTIHIASVSYNSLFLGEFMLPDWDMFHSLHPAAEYHASARAISGGPVYVSDAPGKHDFELLRKLVLPDGSVLRARLPGRPTLDCLFTDPARDNVSLLKIWNMNKYTGVLGVYNCQGAAWSGTERKNVFHSTGTDALTSDVKGDDVHLISEAAVDTEWHGDCAVYRHGASDVVVLPHGAVLPVTLKVLEHSVFTVTPIKVLAPGFKFAPFGLIEMYNAGGAIEELSYRIDVDKSIVEAGDSLVGEPNGAGLIENGGLDPVGFVHLGIKGCGWFGAYSSANPRRCSVDSEDVEFYYDSSSGLLRFRLDTMPENGKVHFVIVEL